jgi:hypothetical protein
MFLFQNKGGKMERIKAMIHEVPHGMKSDVWDK